MKSAPGIAFDYRPSRVLAALAAAIAVLAVCAILASGLGTLPKAILVVVIPLLAAYSLRQFLIPPFVRIARDAGGWQLVTRDGERVTTTLLRHVRLGPLLVLEFDQPPRRRFRCVLAGDVVDAGLRRRLLLVLASEPSRAATTV